VTALEGRQAGLRRRIRGLEQRQALRRDLVAAQKTALDALLEEKDREIVNLKAQMTMGVVG
jgi:hypothetical protein